MKKHVLTLNEYFANLSEEEQEDAAPQEKTPEEEEEEREQDAEDLERDYNIYNVEEAGVQLDFYNELVDGVATKLGLNYDGPYSTQENTVAEIGEKTPLNLEDWNNVYFKVYSDSNDNPPLYIEFITNPDALEKYMDENGTHWPHVFIYEEKKDAMDQVYTMEARETGMLNWLKKEFD